jgi:hypothetical protein
MVTFCFGGKCVINNDAVGWIDFQKIVNLLKLIHDGADNNNIAQSITSAVMSGDAVRLLKGTETTLVKKVNAVGSIISIGDTEMMIFTDRLNCH